jgi:SnoaL-like domain
MDPTMVADRLELRDLVDGYARACDQRDRAALEALFLPDASLTVRRPGAEPHTYEGSAALGEIVPRLGQYARTFHLVANHWCEVDGAKATGEAYCEAHHVRADGASAIDVVLTICYVDAYARTADGWRFASREVQILWTRELPLATGPF